LRVVRQGKIRRDRPAHRPRLHELRIGDGPVACLPRSACLCVARRQGAGHRQVKKGFVGPLVELVSRPAIGWIGRRSEGGRCGGEPQVLEDLLGDALK